MLSIVVCTYNRGDILIECLESVIDTYTHDYAIELIVVDNNCTDATATNVTLLAESHEYIKYIQEPKQGLSHARNTGYRSATYDWVLYLDDDATLAPDFFERVDYLMTQGGYDCIGGLYLPWYKYGQPRWFKDQYASNLKPQYSDLTRLSETEFVSGGIFMVKRSRLIDVGGFDPNYGMTGDTVAYGEEDDLQVRLRQRGIAIAYDPLLIIYHLVPKYKLNTRWFLKSSYNLGKTYLATHKMSYNMITGIGALCIAIAQTAIHLIKYTPRLLLRSYYLENWKIDTFKKPAKWFGAFCKGVGLD